MSPAMAKKRKPKAMRMIRLPLELYRKLQAVADEEGRSLTRQLERIVAAYLRRRNKSEPE